MLWSFDNLVALFALSLPIAFQVIVSFSHILVVFFIPSIIFQFKAFPSVASLLAMYSSKKKYIFFKLHMKASLLDYFYIERYYVNDLTQIFFLILLKQDYFSVEFRNYTHFITEPRYRWRKV